MKPLEDRTAAEQLLDLLVDALEERQRRRVEPPAPGLAPVESRPPAATPQPPLRAAAPADDVKPPEPEKRPEPDNLPEPEVAPVVLPSGQLARFLPRLVIGLLLLLVLINIPLNQHGVSLARAMPNSAALIIRDGLLVKGEEYPEIYVWQDDQLRWVTSLEAFDRLGYRWQDVHIVAESFIDKYEQGPPLYVLLKCDASPHIYRIEREQKRWIKDISTFTAEGHIWEDVHMVSCPYLRSIPDGPTIPPDAGPPPQP